MSETPRIPPDDPLAAALREAFVEERVPSGLEQRLSRSLRALSSPLPAGRLLAGAVIASAAVLIVALVIGFARPHPSALADVPLKELQAFIDSGRAVDVATNDPARVRGWLAQRVSFSPPAVASGDGEIELVGGRLCMFSGRRVASYMYRVHGRLLSIYIMSADGLSATGRHWVEHGGRMLAFTKEGRLSQASWTENGLIYSVVGELPQDGLLSALDQLQPSG
jgi:anti-sigma factor RsiW